MADYRETGDAPTFGEQDAPETGKEDKNEIYIDTNALLNTVLSATISAGVGAYFYKSRKETNNE